MKKRLVSTLLLLAMLLSLVGCSSSTEELDSLNGLSALNSESHVSTSYNLSYTDEQEMIYAQVSNRNLIDMSALTSCSDDEIAQVRNYMESVDRQLIGQVRVVSYADQSSKFMYDGYLEDDAVLDTGMTNYLLTLMEHTPYYWQRTKTTIRGMDAESRSIIVDVDYKTISYDKDIVPDSTIVLGEPDYDRLSESRYRKWISILSKRVNSPNDPTLYAMEQDFLEYWGKPDDIIAEQRRYDPTGTIYMTGNQQTYNGLIDSAAEQTGGTMTVRYVLVPNYVLGINLGMTCEHMYIMRFALDKDITENMSPFTEEGYQTVTDSVYNLIYSYFTCIDESDFNGLYKLTSNFKAQDKYWQDVFNSTYQKHSGFSVSLFDITGTHITCGVTISTKERARGSNITMPIYTDRYYVEIELVEDQLQINNFVWLSRRIEGEPAIAEGEIDSTGFSAIIDLDNDDKVAIEKLICDFSALQLANDTTSEDFTYVVDTSITMNQLNQLKENMTALSGARKVVFLQNYQQGTSNYASVRCKELYQDESNAIVEAAATYEFITKGGIWYVYNYDVNSSIKLDTTNLITAGSLCLVEPGKVISYTSQLKASEGTNLDEVSDISVSFDHKEYKPIKKNGVQEQGLVLLAVSTLTDEIFGDLYNTLGISTDTIEGLDAYLAQIDELVASEGATPEEPLSDYIKDVILTSICVLYNKTGNRYSDVMTQDAAVEEIRSRVDEMNRTIASIAAQMSTQGGRQLTDLMQEYSGVGLALRG